MKGQRLFVRPVEATDHAAIGEFLANESAASAIPASGLLGKLVGNLVSVMAIAITPDSIRMDDLVVARELRRKRVGRVMMLELESLARKLERRTLVVEDARDAGEFLRRVGFRSEGDRWIRELD